MDYLTLKWLHILISTVLFGTGIGAAFFLFAASLRGDPRTCAWAAGKVVLADWLFTTPAVILQPLTGFWLVAIANMPLELSWLAWSIGWYLFAVACWIPVVLIQIRMRAIAEATVAAGTPLPSAYFHCFRIWTLLGFMAFFPFVAIFWLMVFKPG